ncbi:MAG: MFS transporter, partial [Myxococcota bacterium]
MLRRFSLYGFLKNQRYFEPFVLLAMLEVGLSFTQIGLLVGLRELVTAVLEIPSGAIADGLGRRRSMVVAFVAYVAAYATLAMATGVTGFGVGLALIGAGDAFRTGTHKAMIFDWLTSQGRQEERVTVYGYTRSWSQIGSAASIPIAAAAVYATGSYALVFWLAAIPAALNVVNLATYPATLDGEAAARSVRD